MAELEALDFFDAELRAHNRRLRAAAAVRPGDRVLDVGCGAGQTAREAARAAASGRVLGIDVSAAMLERARRHAAAERIHNLTFVLGDAQTHAFEPASYDLVISRCGLMFFADPDAAFGNLARALRPGGRLVTLIWQGYERNEWATALRVSPDAFSLGDPEPTRALLERSGLRDVRFEDVHEPVFYGHDVETALAWARRFTSLGDSQLRGLLAAHHIAERGVWFDSRAWILSAATSA